MISKLWAPGSKSRAVAAVAIGFVAVIVLCNLLPGSGGRRGTPGAIIFQGAIFGLLSGLIAAGIILIYRTSRVINFAQAAIGAAGGVFTYNLIVAETTHFPYLVAVPIGIIISAFVGVVVELGFVRRFFNAPRLVLTVLTIALVPALGFLNGFVANIPIFGDPTERSVLERGGQADPRIPFKGFEFTVGRLADLPFKFGHLLAIGLALATLIGLAIFFKYTKAGVAVRASSENSERAELLGINVKGLSTIVWGITAAISSVGVIMLSSITSFQSAGGGRTSDSALVAALAAAVLARMRSLPIAVSASIGISVVHEAFKWSFREPHKLALFDFILFAMILVGLLLQGKELKRSEAGDTSSWKAVEEFRPTPAEILQVGGIKLWRRVLIVVGILTVLIFPWIVSTGPANLGGFIAIFGIVILSLVVLTGWTGQVSLGQFAFVAVGALIGGALLSKWHINFWLAAPIVIALTGGFAIIIGLPALRIKGLFLAVVTYAFAFAVNSNLFNKEYFGWLNSSGVERPRLFLFDFQDERSMYYLAVVSLLLVVLVVVTLRRSRPGRILIALRENENNLQSFGVNLVRMKLAAFALSGAMCGYAGLLLAVHQRAVTRTTFPPQLSIDVFIFAVIGGIGSVSGGIVGAAYYAIARLFATNPLATLIIGPIGLLLLLYIAPAGLAGIFYGLRDSIYRIVAQRRRMVVPSLFADMDPESLEMQLAPLAEPSSGSGLAVLHFNQRYRHRSKLYGMRGKAYVGKKPVSLKEGAVIGAAAKSVGETEEAEAELLEPSAAEASVS